MTRGNKLIRDLLPPGLVAALATSCIDLTEPWDKVAAVDGSAGTAPRQTGGSAGSATGGIQRRSEFPKDPHLDGEIDEYRIYSRALSDQEIAVLAGG